MGRENSTQKWYVYTGPDVIRTDDGLRTNINGDEDTAKPFIASVGWLRRHRPIHHRLMTLEEYEASQKKAAKPESKPEPEVLMKDFDVPGADFKKPEPEEEKAKPKPKRKRKAKRAE